VVAALAWILPHLQAATYRGGRGAAMVLLPEGAAVRASQGLHTALQETGLGGVTSLQPSHSLLTGPTAQLRALQPQNYNHHTGRWTWTQNTLPDPHPP